MTLHVRHQRCALIVPCYNEAQRLNESAFVDFIAADRNDIELVFVDDGSTDATLDVLNRLAAANTERMHVTQLARNSGKAEAVRQGMLWAIHQGYETVGFWDADLATPLSSVPEFLRVMHRQHSVEVIWGTRLSLLGHTIDRDFVRRQIGRVNSMLSAVASGVPIHDALCGAKMFRNTQKLQAVLAKPFQSRWVFDVELLARFSKLIETDAGASMQEALYEFPLDRWDEISGSKLRSSDFAKAFVEVAAIFLQYRTSLFGCPFNPNADIHPIEPHLLSLRKLNVTPQKVTPQGEMAQETTQRAA